MAAASPPPLALQVQLNVQGRTKAEAQAEALIPDQGEAQAMPTASAESSTLHEQALLQIHSLKKVGSCY